MKIILQAGDNVNNKFTYQEVIDAFGMQEKTILKWIADGRFEGIQYTEGTWIFNEDATWTSMSSKKVPVKEIVKAHNKLSEEVKEMSNNLWCDLIWSIIYNFENRYNGAYEETLKNRINKNHQEKEDEKKWVYYLNEINTLENIEED